MILTKSIENTQWEIYEAPISGDVLDIGLSLAIYLCRSWPGKFLKKHLAMRRVRLGCCFSSRGFLKDQFFDSTSPMIIILLFELIVCVYVKNSVHYQKTQS